MTYTTLTIGSITTTEPMEVTELYECAAWSKVVTVPAGTYDLVAHCGYRDGHPAIGHSIYAQMSGTITGGSMRSRIGAHVSSRDDMVERYGRTDTISRSFCTHFPIADGAVVRTVEHTLRDWRGERSYTAEVVDVADLVLPEGMTLDASQVEVRSIFGSNGVRYASLQPRRDAYTAARTA